MDNFAQTGKTLRELSLCTGAGGGLLGSEILGIRTVCAVEIEPYCAGVLCERQNEGSLTLFPIWDDIKTFNGRPWRGLVDLITAGFPCQDISSANNLRVGLEGAKSSLFYEVYRIICETQPEWVFLENSPLLTGLGLGDVLCRMAAVGYDAEWGVLGAEAIGAPHQRNRFWGLFRQASYSYSKTFILRKQPISEEQKHSWVRRSVWRENESRLGRMDNGVANWMDRLKAIGNGQVPACMAEAFLQLLKRFLE